MSFFVFLAVWDDDLGAHSGCKGRVGESATARERWSCARTEFRDDVPAEEASAPKDGDDVATDGAVSWHARRNDRFPTRQCDYVVERTLKIHARPSANVDKEERSKVPCAAQRTRVGRARGEIWRTSRTTTELDLNDLKVIIIPPFPENPGANCRVVTRTSPSTT